MVAPVTPAVSIAVVEGDRDWGQRDASWETVKAHAGWHQAAEALEDQ